MGAALALSERGRGLTDKNPNVGCIIVNNGVVVGRGFTQPSGRPHAEAMALAQAGENARGATAYVTLEPCASPGHGPACADGLIKAGVARVVAAIGDPFPAVNGKGFAKLRDAGIDVITGPGAAEAARAMTGFLTRQRLGRPHVTLKLALSIDGCISMADGTSQWITGPEARAHAHLERARHEAILVGRGTWEADAPKLDVRLTGLQARSPTRYILSSQSPFVPSPLTARRAGAQDKLRPSDEVAAPVFTGSTAHELHQSLDFARDERAWVWLPDLNRLPAIASNHLLVEGGAEAAASFLREDLVDRLLIYRAPILIGGGRTLPDIGLVTLAEAHGRWHLQDRRCLGSDTLDVYERVRG
jgi:diaminohydroxyphosphoribosylaminopyrimidine deaminase / 5-amino-6-(5-phosphoribosylamino)uracil reductase